jgi:hypothetical protein
VVYQVVSNFGNPCNPQLVPLLERLKSEGLVDELFDWASNITNFPIGTKGIHDYMIIFEGGSYMGNPFEGCYPAMDYTQTLEWPLMQFMGMPPQDRGIYRTTGIMLMNQKCLDFINIWWDLCKILPKISNIKKIAPFQEETIYNALYWKWGDVGFPLCYVNLDNGLETVKDFYTRDTDGSYLVNYDENDFTKHFYKIPYYTISSLYEHLSPELKNSFEINILLKCI